MIGGGMNKLFRRQFVMGWEVEEKGVLKDFKKENLGELSLFVHRDLPLTRIDDGARSIVLLGYLINPSNYKASDREILSEILEDSDNFSDVLNKTLGLVDKWLKEKKDFARNKNLDLMKLFYWEMRMPNWGSQYQQEADLAMEEFAPFNNREIILRLLDLSKNKDYKDVFDDIIYYLDPKLLDFPINPRNKKEKLRDMVKNNVSKRSWERIKVVLKK